MSKKSILSVPFMGPFDLCSICERQLFGATVFDSRTIYNSFIVNIVKYFTHFELSAEFSTDFHSVLWL